MDPLHDDLAQLVPPLAEHESESFDHEFDRAAKIDEELLKAKVKERASADADAVQL